MYQGEDPVGISLIGIVDTDDLEGVADLFTSRLVDLQVEEGPRSLSFPSRPPSATQPSWPSKRQSGRRESPGSPG